MRWWKRRSLPDPPPEPEHGKEAASEALARAEEHLAAAQAAVERTDRLAAAYRRIRDPLAEQVRRAMLHGG